jgi:pimeloyl-ACP methyl ester carboxylesterase
MLNQIAKISFKSAAAALVTFGLTAASGLAAPVKNIVLVHGAWVDGSGWKPVYEILVREKTADGFTYLNPADFPKLFAPDLPQQQAVFESRSQVLAAAKVFNTPLTAAAWRTKPTWGVVALADQIINPDLEKWYYERAHSHVTEIAGASHSVYESHPKEVAAVIEQAAEEAENQVHPSQN